MSKPDASFQARFDLALKGVRSMMANFNLTAEQAVELPMVDADLRPHLLAEMLKEQSIRITDPLMLMAAHKEWLPDLNRDSWYYWPRLRAHLLEHKGWPDPTVRSIDRITDKILGAMENPAGTDPFDTRGLVVGYVQSGKTANYSALIAKATDAGYRLIIVLTGIHNTLRLQTQRRLDSELVGKVNGKWGGVGRPTPNREWITYTHPTERGDFNPGFTSAATLTLDLPSLMVIKKNASVLKALINWLKEASEEVRKRIPVLVIDDEADQASVNTGGNRAVEDLDQAEVNDDESPTTINLRIRELLQQFDRKAYVAYTATPFANVLIDHTALDREGGLDLYPKSFIVSLPRPHGYYGAERIFGTADGSSAGMPIIQVVPETDIPLLVPARRNEIPDFHPTLTDTLLAAMDDFVLAGAARMHRGALAQPATMLIHTSYSTIVQERLWRLVQSHMEQFSDDWHYSRQRRAEMATRLKARWESEFRPVTRSENAALDVPFTAVEEHIAPFLKRLQVLQINNMSEDQLDYERDPDLKVIVVGGNRLSRGLTLEGLLVSYFVRASKTYDTLMQMGRWFGYRDGYADLTRIYTTGTLHGWFRDLATIEEELRDEIARYEREGLTPLELGMKIRQHPSMMVTSPLKMQRVDNLNISFSGQLVQTITFPFHNHDWLQRNIAATREFLSGLGPAGQGATKKKPVWTNVPARAVIEFLENYATDPEATRVRTEPIQQYIAKQLANGELTDWVVGVMGNQKGDPVLGALDLQIANCPEINLIERTRLADQMASLKAIISPADEKLGMSEQDFAKAKELRADSKEKLSESRALRSVRDRRQGLLLIYPISRNSGFTPTSKLDKGRAPIFPQRDAGVDIIGIAVIFPESNTAATVEYVIGSVGPGEW